MPCVNFIKRPVILFALALLVGAGCLPQAGRLDGKVCFSKTCFDVEVVSSEVEVKRGLQNRESLARGTGMLFIFSQNYPYRFWMKDTLIPLDMIWLNYARRVVHIEANVPPCQTDPCPTYAPGTDALYVLEINAGAAKDKGLSLGDQAEFKIDEF